MIRTMPTFSPKSLYGPRCTISHGPQDHSNPRSPQSPLEPVVDLDRVVERGDYGNIEITSATAREIGSVVGMISQDQADTLEDTITALTAERDELVERLQTKEAACSALASELHEASKAIVEARDSGYARGYEQGCHDTEVVEA